MLACFTLTINYCKKTLQERYNAPMADITIENFYKHLYKHIYKHIAKILSIFLAYFPTKAPIYVGEVAGVDAPDDYGLHSPTCTGGFFAMLWLADEDY